MWVMAGCFLAPPALSQEAAEGGVSDAEAKQLFETTCSACHTLALPQSQRLNRANWEWVVDDMVNQFGCPIGEREQKIIIDYLVKHHGPDS